MADIRESLDALMKIRGSIGAAIVDYETGMTLGTVGGGGFDMEVAAAGKTGVVRSTRDSIQNMNTEESTNEILIQMDSLYHLIKMFGTGDTFTYVILDIDESTLALARRKLQQVDENLVIE